MHWPDSARVAARLEALWEIARGPAGGADRPAWSKAEAAAVRLVARWADEAGLQTAIDPYGNFCASPSAHGQTVVSCGSHLDTVPDGGRFDGALGVVLALEAAAALPSRVCVLSCAAEEAPRFGAGTLGSRLLTGGLTEGNLAALADADGVSAAAARNAFLAELGDLPRAERIPLQGGVPMWRSTSSSAAIFAVRAHASGSSSESLSPTGTRSWSKGGRATPAKSRWGSARTHWPLKPSWRWRRTGRANDRRPVDRGDCRLATRRAWRRQRDSRPRCLGLEGRGPDAAEIARVEQAFLFACDSVSPRGESNDAAPPTRRCSATSMPPS